MHLPAARFTINALMAITRKRARIAACIIAMLVVAAIARCGLRTETGAREHARRASQLYRDGAFIDAIAEYEQALTQIDDATIHFNIGLAYARLFRPGLDVPIPIGEWGSVACDAIPGVVAIDTRVCGLASPRVITDRVAAHLQIWLAANDDDHETRRLMSQLWIDSGQFQKAIDYWEARLAHAPADPAIMQTLAGISLKANDWRASIAWYQRVASGARDTGAKVSALHSIGLVAWSRLSSRSVPAADRRELADRGIEAVHQAIELAPTNAQLVGLEASIFKFRALAQASPTAAAEDRATAERLLQSARSLSRP